VDDGLLRSAELLAGPFEDDAIAIEVESLIVNGVDERNPVCQGEVRHLRYRFF